MESFNSSRCRCCRCSGGALADRFPKRRVLVITQSIIAMQSLTLAMIGSTGRIQIWHIYVLAAIRFWLRGVAQSGNRGCFCPAMR